MEMKVIFAFIVLVAISNDYANAAASGKNRSIHYAKIYSFFNSKHLEKFIVGYDNLSFAFKVTSF